MADPKRMITGFNHNIRHNGKIYHVQTEDSGVGSPHIITHLFLGGNILASKKTSYADIAGADNLANVVRELMEEQHKEVLRNLVNGVYDQVPTGPAGQPRAVQPPQPAPGAAHAAKPVPPAAPGPTPGPPAVERAETPQPVDMTVDTVFGEDLISEKSLDEVILSYLAEDGEEKK
jgi:hypothetical protein